MVARRLNVVLLAGAAALAAAPAEAGKRKAPKPTNRTVKVGDNFLSPRSLTVNRGSTITWRWPDDTGDVHDVELRRRPKGVRKFASAPAATSFTYRRRLTVRGRYRIICTFHEDEMVMTITVRK